MSAIGDETLPIRSDSEVVMVRQRVRVWATQLGFSLIDQTKVVTAASELARNVLVHGGGGTARIEAINDGARKGLKLTFEEQRPRDPRCIIGTARWLHHRRRSGAGLEWRQAAFQRIRDCFRRRTGDSRHHREMEVNQGGWLGQRILCQGSEQHGCRGSSPYRHATRLSACIR